MAVSTGSSVNRAGFISALDSLLGSNGWTVNESTSTLWHASKGDLNIAMGFETGYAVLCQNLGYGGAATAVNAHTNDSGGGVAGSTSERHIEDFDGTTTFQNYWIFYQTSPVDYVHVVIEVTAEVFIHFGWGELVKVGTTGWTGGEYCYGYYHGTNVPPNLIGATQFLLDGGSSGSAGAIDRSATIHIEGFPNMPAATKWGAIYGDITRVSEVDGDSNERAIIQGGFRGGPEARRFAQFEQSFTSGFQPGYPITLYYIQNDGVGNDEGVDHVYKLGCMDGVVGASLKNIPAKTVVNIGGDDWYFFPARRRSEDTGVSERTLFMGMAYKD